MNSYPLNTPTKRNLYIPGADESTSTPVIAPKHSGETDQTHRNMTWLLHKPQNHSILPFQPIADKMEKKKRSD
jgi:hypothetical protein